MTSRPYTGNSDGNHPNERPGTKRFVEFMEYLFGMKSLGIYANRPMRGSANLSVHATVTHGKRGPHKRTLAHPVATGPM